MTVLLGCVAAGLIGVYVVTSLVDAVKHRQCVDGIPSSNSNRNVPIGLCFTVVNSLSCYFFIQTIYYVNLWVAKSAALICGLSDDHKKVVFKARMRYLVVVCHILLVVGLTYVTIDYYILIPQKMQSKTSYNVVNGFISMFICAVCWSLTLAQYQVNIHKDKLTN